ncbi:MAG TPA: phosphonate C-P lyase system protein PhnG [Syntrophales bacterium]|nr:phosphonate C-P lyase system protein PhnG [Syntrophobacterales bacterium]HQL91599.1 phosphonate C-P lyase system protein PhnG [Syntrophales bacterium]
MKPSTSAAGTELPDCIMHLPEKAVRKLLGLVPGEAVTVVRGPQTGLVMMSAMDSHEAEFYLGEVLVTEAEVDYRGSRGYGMVLGDDADRAIARATVEAIGASPDRVLRERVRRFLAAERRKLETRNKRAASLTAATRVNFETMKRT